MQVLVQVRLLDAVLKLAYDGRWGWPLIQSPTGLVFRQSSGRGVRCMKWIEVSVIGQLQSSQLSRVRWGVLNAR